MGQDILFSLFIDLQDFSQPDVIRPHGPLFHRWLPNGEEDGFELDTGERNVELRVWFCRRGDVRNGVIRFDSESRNIDPEVMRKQAVLDAGPVEGLLRIRGAAQETINVLVANQGDHPSYMNLGKRAVYRIYRSLTHLIRVFRVNFGQYWLKLPRWDERRESLGNYCSDVLNLQWRLEDDEDWHDFGLVRAAPIFHMKKVPDEEYRQYITEGDYRKLADILQSDYQPTLATELAASAHRIYDETENLPHALIEAVTALEVAMREFVRSKINDGELFSKAESFWNLSMPAKTVFMASMCGNVSDTDMRLAIDAINLRNGFVHGGKSVADSSQNREAFRALLCVISALVAAPVFKHPHGSVDRNTVYER